ncbi:WD40-repeat-containing domain protein [Gilbertella persicaria]|uniref:WD40-repeat-containing domain protein n=1 Tax=Gilbertella persicaria TaxID=101096 RepID=UPI00221FDEBE|nr:WD40-repeat-containing domain protein [Gilbertella persicaria]KAI8079094.1 WD40-repeat-containing domain protein [Gilbertella persicaria]
MSVEATCLISKELPFTPYDIKWIPISSKLCVVGATGEGAGKISVYGLHGKQLELKHETETSSAIRCGTITGQSRQLATGDFEGHLQIWDIQRFDIPLVSFKAHDSIINAIDSYNQAKEPQELVTASRDGTVKVWDVRQPEKAVLTITSKETQKDIWAVAFGQFNGHKLVAVGYEDGNLKLFDVDGSQYIWQTNVKDGICSIDFNHEKLLVSTLSGACLIDIKTGNATEIISTSEPANTLWSIRHIPQASEYFSVASGDGQISIFNQSSLTEPLHFLPLSKHPIISLDWHKDKKGLFACSSFDQTIKVGHATIN